MAMLFNWFNTHRMRAIALAFICGVLVSINSPAFAGASISIEWGKGGEPVKQKSVKKQSKAGPPPPMPRRMEIEPNTNIDIIRRMQSTTIPLEGFTFTCKATIGRSRRHCRAS